MASSKPFQDSLNVEYGENHNFPNSRPGQYIDHYYNLENIPKQKKFVCETCNANFFSHYKLKEHINQHVECPFPECKLSANPRLIDQHINHQHMLVNFESLQIDDEAWIAHRKKQFPTVERAKLRMAEQLEKFKRGERLGKDKRNFAKNKNRNERNTTDWSNNERNATDRPKLFNIKRGNQNRNIKGKRVKLNKEGRPSFEQITCESRKGNPVMEVGLAPASTENVNGRAPIATNLQNGNNLLQFHSKSELTNDLKKNEPSSTSECNKGQSSSMPISDHSDSDDSDLEMKFGIPAFKGTRILFESTGEISLFGVQTTKDVTDQLMDISDEEDWNNDVPAPMQDKKISFQNALGSLIGAYASGSDSELDEDKEETTSSHLTETNQGTTVHENETQTKPEADSSNWITNKPNSFSDNKNFGKRKRRRRPPMSNKSKTDRRDPNKRFPAKFNASRPYRRRLTLLEKLLKPDIIHERNVILQCIRYIIENNYFKSSPSVGDEKQTLNMSIDESAIIENNNFESTPSLGDAKQTMHMPIDESAIIEKDYFEPYTSVCDAKQTLNMPKDESAIIENDYFESTPSVSDVKQALNKPINESAIIKNNYLESSPNVGDAN